MNNAEITLRDDEIMALDYARFDQIETILKKHRVYEEWIDDLSCDAQVKNILKQLLDVTHRVGGKLYQIGKAVLEFLMEQFTQLKEKYSKTFDLAVIGALLSLLIWCIPGIGLFIGPVVTPPESNERGTRDAFPLTIRSAVNAKRTI